MALVYEQCIVCKAEKEGPVFQLQHATCSQRYLVHRECLPVACCATLLDARYSIQHGDSNEPKWKKAAFKNSRSVTSYAAY